MSKHFMQNLETPFTEFLPQNSFYSFVQTQPIAKPSLLAWSKEAASVCLDIAEPLSQDQRIAFEQYFSGNQLPDTIKPYATRYGGHQFGHWAGQLGDGRATTLGQYTNAKGVPYEIQLKGAGLTPYSRHADGRAVLRSSLREFLCSEAMFALGVPTTRALCCIQSTDKVVRDMFYDGHPEHETVAITTRLAPSFIRFGHFEMFAGDSKNLNRLIDYVLQHYFVGMNTPEEMFHQVCETTAQLMIEWMALGFVHGVMNTDNMSILGLSIDYGPFGWLDRFEANWTPNTTDFRNRRYCYQNQPSIAAWNLKRLAEVIHESGAKADKLEQSLNHYKEFFQRNFYKRMSQKLGLVKVDEDFIQDTLELLAAGHADMVLFFRTLSEHLDLVFGDLQTLKLNLEKSAFCYDPVTSKDVQNLEHWLRRYRKCLEGADLELNSERMKAINPVVVPRNYILQQIIDDVERDNNVERLHRYQQAMQTPYTRVEAFAEFYGPRPQWAETRPGCAVLSCSS
jgi:serine/tyrosine/threonine adenylyltransferase